MKFLDDLLKKGDDRLAKEEDHALAVLKTLDPESDDYRRVLENVERIRSMRQKTRRVSPDAIFSGAVTLTSILVILLFEEHGSLLTSKAATFINKPKL